MNQCGGTVWNSMVEQWNSVAQCGGTVWNSMVRECGTHPRRPKGQIVEARESLNGRKNNWHENK